MAEISRAKKIIAGCFALIFAIQFTVLYVDVTAKNYYVLAETPASFFGSEGYFEKSIDLSLGCNMTAQIKISGDTVVFAITTPNATIAQATGNVNEEMSLLTIPVGDCEANRTFSVIVYPKEFNFSHVFQIHMMFLLEGLGMMAVGIILVFLPSKRNLNYAASILVMAYYIGFILQFAGILKF